MFRSSFLCVFSVFDYNIDEIYFSSSLLANSNDNEFHAIQAEMNAPVPKDDSPAGIKFTLSTLRFPFT